MLRCGELDVFVRVDGRQEKEGDGDGRGKVRWAETESQRCNFGTEPKTKNTLSTSYLMQGTIHDTRRGRGHRAYNVAWDVKSTQMQTRYVHNADKILPPPLAQFLKSDSPTLLSNKDIYLPRTSLQWVEERNQSRPAAASAPCGGSALRPSRARSRANERRISSDRERRARGQRQKVVHFFLAAAAGEGRRRTASGRGICILHLLDDSTASLPLSLRPPLCSRTLPSFPLSVSFLLI